MKVLIATMPFAGHIHPAQPIARALVRRGHAVAWLTSASHEHLVTPTGATFVASPPALARHDETPLAPEPGTSGLAAVVSTLRQLFLDRVPDQVAAYRAAIEEFGADVLLVDLTAYGAHCLRDLGGPPYATLGINPLVTLDAEVPPWGTGWSPPKTPFGRWVNALAHAAAGRLLYPRLTAPLNEQRAVLGLPPLPATGFFDATRSDALHLMPTTPAFEFPRKNLHPAVTFVGPLLPLFGDDDDEETALPAWWGEMLAHPRDKVVHVTQGTYATNAANLISPTLSALRGRADLLVIATTPDAETVFPAGTLPDNARVADFVPHAKLLPHVGVMVTNAGYNGVLAALSCGVPMVCAGRTEDKADVSARVAWSGAGIDLGTNTPGEKALGAAVQRVVSDPRYRRAAERIRDDFAAHNGPEEAADHLERLAGPGRR
ncbi:PdmS protein [Colletotrichum navitas]|uniref:PdmS protein n=1 Tax=Colletotrichum navitas TaxID=681940 RepID=A0AAD8UYI8_9PEZI|nr:PdmS protein [Colletotrichum navitas]KAK1569717.1 PdmS protein [Colletotrichum navitas]